MVATWLCALALGAALHACSWNPKQYVVRPGDTLHLIAWRYNLKPQDLAEWNNLDNPNLIYPGQRLALSAGAIKAPASAGKKNKKRKKRKVVRDKKFDESRKEDWSWPVPGTAAGDVLEEFAWNGKEGRKGISIAGADNDAVLAARSGTVVYVGDDISGYGNMVIVQHDELLLSAYGHNKRVTVKEGDWVKQGEQIAVMGQTDTNRIKLYFEIRRDSAPIDPLSLLPQ